MYRIQIRKDTERSRQYFGHSMMKPIRTLWSGDMLPFSLTLKPVQIKAILYKQFKEEGEYMIKLDGINVFRGYVLAEHTMVGA